MLTDQDRAKFEEVLGKLTALMKPNQIAAIVPQRLYVDSAGNWSAKFDMSGYPIGNPRLEDLLKDFIFAETGLEISDEVIEKSSDQICLRLIEAIEGAILQLRTMRAG